MIEMSSKVFGNFRKSLDIFWPSEQFRKIVKNTVISMSILVKSTLHMIIRYEFYVLVTKTVSQIYCSCNIKSLCSLHRVISSISIL